MLKLAPFLLAVSLYAQNPTGGFTLRMFVHPEGQLLHVLVRAPLEALNPAAIPYRGTSGELDLARAGAILPSIARWSLADHIEIFEGKTPLSKPEIAAARLSLPADNAFASYDAAWTHIRAPKFIESTQIFRDQAMVDVLLDYAIQSPASSFSIRPSLARLAPSVTTELQFLPLPGATRTFEYTGDPGLFSLDPTSSQVFARFAGAGFWQILKSTDALLFLFCLALGIHGVGRLFSFTAIFAAAHSLALLASAYGAAVDALWFPLCIEVLVALSILYLAFEVMAGKPLIRPRWALAFFCGIVFGYTFSCALLPTRPFAGEHFLVCVLSFNLGIEAGIACALVIFAGALPLLFRFAGGRLTVRTETLVLSVLVADLAWHRLTDRVDRLRQFNFHWPEDVAISPLGWAAIVLVMSGALLIAFAFLQKRKTSASPSSPATPGPDLSS